MEKEKPIHGNPRQAALWTYIAGIIDGEGSLSIKKDTKCAKRNKMINPMYYAYFSIGMVNKEILELLKETFGYGNLREERVPNKRSIWRYFLTGRHQIIDALENLMPYLRVKKAHAEIVMDFCKNFKTPYRRSAGIDLRELRRREDLYQKIKKLNAVGAAATTEQENTRESEATV